MFRPGRFRNNAALSPAAGGGGPLTSDEFITRAGLSGTDETNYRNLIDGLDTDGIWAKLSQLWVLAAPDTATAHRNLVSSSNTLSPSGSVTFNADRGYHGVDASTTAYIDTNLAAFTVTTNKHMMAWCNGDSSQANGASSGMLIAHQKSSATANYIQLRSRRSSDGTYGANLANSAGASGVASDGDSRHMLLTNKTSTTSQELYVDGVGQGAMAVTSGAPTLAGNILLLAQYDLVSGTVGAGCALQISFVSFGQSLTPTEITNYHSRLTTFRTAVGL